MNEEEIQNWKDDIDAMSHEDMCRLWRFAPSGHPVFNREFPLSDYFDEKFAKLGRFTPEISKKIG